MDIRRRLAVVLLFDLLFTFKTIKSFDVINSFRTILKTFENERVYENISADVYLGLIIAQGFLQGSLEGNQTEDDVLLQCEKKLLNKITRLQEKSYVQNFEDISFYKQIIINNLILQKWNLKDRKYYNVLQDPTAIDIIPWKDYTKIVEKGIPSRNLSDFCLAQILVTKSCAISSKCLKLFEFKEKSYGYHATHRILFLLLLNKNQCNSLIPFTTTAKIILSHFCSKIYEEILIIYLVNTPVKFHDLFLEQVLLCGISGFTEFFNKIFINEILSWQNSNGCFTENFEVNNNYNDNNYCNNHMTGLGIAFLSYLVNYAATTPLTL